MTESSLMRLRALLLYDPARKAVTKPCFEAISRKSVPLAFLSCRRVSRKRLRTKMSQTSSRTCAVAFSRFRISSTSGRRCHGAFFGRRPHLGRGAGQLPVVANRCMLSRFRLCRHNRFRTAACPDDVAETRECGLHRARGSSTRNPLRGHQTCLGSRREDGR